MRKLLPHGHHHHFFFLSLWVFFWISELNWFAEWSRKQQKYAKHSPLWGSELLDLCPRRNVGEATALKKGEEESQGNASLLQLLVSFFFFFPPSLSFATTQNSGLWNSSGLVNMHSYLLLHN